MPSLIEKIKSLAAAHTTETVAYRHHIHQHPELSYQEFETQAYVQKQLADMGIASSPLANTGLVALIEGKNPTSRVVALRADMDALPILETNDVPYKSQNPGLCMPAGMMFIPHLCWAQHIYCNLSKMNLKERSS
jgi:metal-dependent amidase/aminoacylase/carboxypeptidase family protein